MDFATPKQVYERLSMADILEVCSSCFREGHFDAAGEIPMHHETSFMDTHHKCREEYRCEFLAAIILMPIQSFNCDLAFIRQAWCPGPIWNPIRWLAQRYAVESWAVRFRICLLDEGYFDPYRFDGHGH